MLDTGLLIFTKQIITHNPWIDRIEVNKPVRNNRLYLLSKRAVDLLIILFALPLLVPMFFLCAIFVKLEDPRGPIFFVQMRTGKDGKRFGMYKFRTMVFNAEELKHDLISYNELQWPDFKIKNDPRITWVGRILRKTSLDELPQLINVLKGDMSLVGPRPTSFSPNTYALWQTGRLDVTPGITGLWQILGRGSMDFTCRVYLDTLYLERRCLRMDLEILIRTIFAVMIQRGAH